MIDIKFIHISLEREKEHSHFHNEHQILIFLSGEGWECIKDKKFKVFKGAVVFIPEGTFHSFISEKKKTSEILSIRFNILGKEKGKFIHVLNKPFFTSLKKEKIEGILKNLYSLLTTEKGINYFREFVENLLLQKGEKISRKKREYLRKIEGYIDKNLKEEITAEDISKYCGITENYVRKIVKSVYGVNLTKLINKKRVELASHLLLTTNLSIKDIAWKVGIPDYNYFSRVFKSIKGVSPSRYRKNPV